MKLVNLLLDYKTSMLTLNVFKKVGNDLTNLHSGISENSM